MLYRQFGEIKPEKVSYTEWPEAVVRHFINQSGKGTLAPDLVLDQFNDTYVFESANGNRSFTASHTKSYGDGTVRLEEIIYLADSDKLGNLIGFSHVRFDSKNELPYWKNKPFVGNTETSKSSLRVGLGFRRLYLMNEMTSLVFGLSLHSDISYHIKPDAQRLWQRAIACGDAEDYMQGQFTRFKFLSTSEVGLELPNNI